MGKVFTNFLMCFFTVSKYLLFKMSAVAVGVNLLVQPLLLTGIVQNLVTIQEH